MLELPPTPHPSRCERLLHFMAFAMYDVWEKFARDLSDSDSEEDIVRIRREEHESIRKRFVAEVQKEERERFGCGARAIDVTDTLDDYYFIDGHDRVIVHVRLPTCLQNANIVLDLQFRSQSFNADIMHEERRYRFAITETPMEFIADKSHGELVNDELVIELVKFGKVPWERLQC